MLYSISIQKQNNIYIIFKYRPFPRKKLELLKKNVAYVNTKIMNHSLQDEQHKNSEILNIVAHNIATIQMSISLVIHTLTKHPKWNFHCYRQKGKSSPEKFFMYKLGMFFLCSTIFCVQIKEKCPQLTLDDRDKSNGRH